MPRPKKTTVLIYNKIPVIYPITVIDPSFLWLGDLSEHNLRPETKNTRYLITNRCILCYLECGSVQYIERDCGTPYALKRGMIGVELYILYLKIEGTSRVIFF